MGGFRVIRKALKAFFGIGEAISSLQECRKHGDMGAWVL